MIASNANEKGSHLSATPFRTPASGVVSPANHHHPAEELLKGSAAVKRRSLGFWEGGRLGDLLELARAREFVPGEKLTAVDLERDARQSAACGHHLKLHFPLVDQSTGEVGRPYVHKGYYCQMPAVCPICSRRVGDVRQAKYAPKIEAALEAGLDPYLLTFTVAACNSLPGQLARLRPSLRRFQTMFRPPRNTRKDPDRRKRWLERGGLSGEWQKVAAAGLKIEVKRGEGDGLLPGQWHVHAHALVFTAAPLDYRIYANAEDKAAGRPMRLVKFRGREVAASKISAEWLKSTGGEAMGVDVHPLFIDRKTGRRMDRRGVVQAAREVMKYVCDLDERSTSNDWLDIRVGTWGRRLWSVYGEFRGLGDDDYTEEGDGGDVEEVNVTWSGGWAGEYGAIGTPKKISMAGRKEFSLKCLTARARVNGMCRKIRGAIFRARETYETTGRIPRGFVVEIISPSDGERKRIFWPRPSFLKRGDKAAADGSAWARWLNEVTAAARQMTATLEVDLNQMSEGDALSYRMGDTSGDGWESWTNERRASTPSRTKSAAEFSQFMCQGDRDLWLERSEKFRPNAMAATISAQTWEGFQAAIAARVDAKERAAALEAIAFGGLQQDLLSPDYFARGGGLVSLDVDRAPVILRVAFDSVSRRFSPPS